jgi:hypothetical protein
MSKPKMRIANLDEESLARVQELEEQFETVILAVEPRYAAAELTEDQLNRLKRLEQELDVILIAYKQP